MRRLARSWSIFRKSLAVINQERKLLIFPLISAFAAVRLLVFSAFDPITSLARRASRPLLHV